VIELIAHKKKTHREKEASGRHDSHLRFHIHIIKHHREPNPGNLSKRRMFFNSRVDSELDKRRS
jgi:hypothetical protein